MKAFPLNTKTENLYAYRFYLNFI